MSRPTVYRVLARHAPKASPSPAAPGDALASRPNGDQVATPQPEVNLRPMRESPEPLSAGLRPAGHT